MGAVPLDRLGVASGLLNYSRVFGQSTGLPLIGSIFTLFVVSVTLEPVRTDFAAVSPEALSAGIAGAYRFQALLLLAAVALGIAAWIVDHRRIKAARRPSTSSPSAVP